MTERNVRFTGSIAATLLTATVLVASLPAPARAAASPRPMCRVAAASPVDQLLANAYPSQAKYAYNQGIDMRDDTGYNTDYLFAMTKAVASGPVTPFLKPLLFLFTVPLDIITLPFTAIAGFF
jgi:hypothetical protein